MLGRVGIAARLTIWATALGGYSRLEPARPDAGDSGWCLSQWDRNGCWSKSGCCIPPIEARNCRTPVISTANESTNFSPGPHVTNTHTPNVPPPNVPPVGNFATTLVPHRPQLLHACIDWSTAATRATTAISRSSYHRIFD